MEWVKRGWGNNGRRERDGGEEKKGIDIHPHVRSPPTFQP